MLFRKFKDHISKLENSINAVLEQVGEIDKKTGRYDMAIENLLDEIQDDREQAHLAEDALEAQQKSTDSLLSLISVYQEHFWQIRQFFPGEDDPIAQQLALMDRNLKNAGIKSGITEICETGVPVDYELHTVTDIIPSDTCDKTVAAIYSPGYLYQGKVIKKAKISAYRGTNK